jgi:hypothetical protein
MSDESVGLHRCCKVEPTWTTWGPLHCLRGIGGRQSGRRSHSFFTQDGIRDMADAGLTIDVSNGWVHTRATGNAACPRECLVSSAVNSSAQSGLDAWQSARADACRRFVVDAAKSPP